MTKLTKNSKRTIAKVERALVECDMGASLSEISQKARLSASLVKVALGLLGLNPEADGLYYLPLEPAESPSIDALKLSPSVSKSLKENGVNTIADLRAKSREELLSMNRIGVIALTKINWALVHHGWERVA